MSDEKTTEAAHPAEISFAEFTPPSYAEWKEEAIATLNGAPFERRLLTKTYEEITLEPIYTQEMLDKLVSLSEFPKTSGYLRGSSAAGYVAKPWTIAQAIEAPLPDNANTILKQELERGSEAIHLLLHSSLLQGYEDAGVGVQCDGKRGVILESLNDIRDLLEGIDPADYEMDIPSGISAMPILALLAAHAKAYGNKDKQSEYHGRVGADPLGILALTGKLPLSQEILYDEMAETVRWALVNMPKVRTIQVRGSIYHEAGASSVTELALCFATAIEYIRALLDRGLDIEQIAKQISFSLAIGPNFLMEIAKFRAARLVWAQVIEAFGGNSDVQTIDILAETSRFVQSKTDPYVNILRATTQAFSAIVGGIDALTVLPFDGAIGSSDDLSRRVSRNIQLMFQNEFEMLQPIDPAGGSWCIETLTIQIAEAVWSELQKNEEEMGIFARLQKGSIQDALGATLNTRVRNLATRLDRSVGTNMYANISEEPLVAKLEDQDVLQQKREQARASNLSQRDEAIINSAMAELTAKSSGEQSQVLFDAVIAALLAGATLDEIRHTLSSSSAAVEAPPLKTRRLAEDYEELREVTRRYEEAKGHRFKVFLANMGPPAQHKARADFSIGFMEVAGFEVLSNNGFTSVDEASAAAIASRAEVTVICSTDETYPEIVPALTKKIKATCQSMMVILAGAPAEEHQGAYNEAGLDNAIHIRANCITVLQSIQKAKGMS